MRIMKDKVKKSVTFNENLNINYTYEPTEDVQQLTWTQIAIDEMRFRKPLELMLKDKMKHLVSCNKMRHDECAQFTSMVSRHSAAQ